MRRIFEVPYYYYLLLSRATEELIKDPGWQSTVGGGRVSHIPYISYLCQIRLGRLRIFLREVSKLFKCYVLFQNFDRKPAMSLKTLEIGLFNKLL